MLTEILVGSEVGDTILEWMEAVALAIEILAVAVITIAIAYAFILYSSRGIRERDKVAENYHELKVWLGKVLILSLEILVAADIVRTVALETTLESVAILGLLVLVRTFLSWSLVVEIEGRWPWQAKEEQA